VGGLHLLVRSPGRCGRRPTRCRQRAVNQGGAQRATAPAQARSIRTLMDLAWCGRRRGAHSACEVQCASIGSPLGCGFLSNAIAARLTMSPTPMIQNASLYAIT
jgi:hypothetical protein